MRENTRGVYVSGHGEYRRVHLNYVKLHCDSFIFSYFFIFQFCTNRYNCMFLSYYVPVGPTEAHPNASYCTGERFLRSRLLRSFWARKPFGCALRDRLNAAAQVPEDDALLRRSFFPNQEARSSGTSWLCFSISDREACPRRKGCKPRIE